VITQQVYEKLPGNIKDALDDLTRINKTIEETKLRVMTKAKKVAEIKKRGVTNVRQ